MRKALITLTVGLAITSAAYAQVVTAGRHKIMLFGGEDHKVYLGCLSCSKYANDSVLNRYGPHGSKYATDSIFNRYGEYGSPYSSTSPCNPYASSPPVIVDEDGDYYGELTINTTRSKRAQSEPLNSWIAGVCQGEE
jgi:hypothetical protein